MGTHSSGAALLQFLFAGPRWCVARIERVFTLVQAHFRRKRRAWTERTTPERAEIRRLESAFSVLCSNVESLQAKLRELEANERAALPDRGSLALNLTMKGLAVKLARSGQDARRIAATLGVPAGEVELLLKVQELQSRPAAAAGALQ